MRGCIAALALLACAACKKSEPEAAPDAGPDPNELVDAKLGIALRYPGTWIPAAVTSKSDEVRVLLDARRAPVGRPYLVAPRLVVTAEPTGADGARRAADRALDDLLDLERKGQLRITRKLTGERRYGGTLAIDFEVAYEVQAQGAPVFRGIEQRSLFVFRRLADGSRAIVTLTATYLAEDAALLGPETEQTWSGLSLREPAGAGLDGGAGPRGTAP